MKIDRIRLKILRIKKNVLCLVCLFVLTACNNAQQNKKEKTIIPVLSITEDIISVTSLDKNSHKINIVCNKETLCNKSFTEIWKSDITALLQNYSSLEELALFATSGLNDKPRIPLNITIDSSIDTLIYIPIKTLKIEDRKSSIKGKCAQLFLSSIDPNLKVELKKWLFRRQEHVGEYRINKMMEIINTLKQKGYNEYITNEEIPVMKNFSGKTYSVSSNMKADHYVLFAFSTEKEISDFVEEIVSNDFDLTKKSVGSSMNCYRDVNSSGYKCIALIGINNDWSYVIEPLGLVCIDNIAPAINIVSGGIEYSDIYLRKNNSVIVLPEHMNINGVLNIDTQQFRGDNAQFVIHWNGDIKDVTIKREIRRSYSWLKPGSKKIDLSDKTSPYYFSYELDLGIGDNYIPVIVTDNAGNNATYSLHIPMEAVENNNPDINIDNNINVW